VTLSGCGTGAPARCRGARGTGCRCRPPRALPRRAGRRRSRPRRPSRAGRTSAPPGPSRSRCPGGTGGSRRGQAPGGMPLTGMRAPSDSETTATRSSTSTAAASNPSGDSTSTCRVPRGTSETRRRGLRSGSSSWIWNGPDPDRAVRMIRWPSGIQRAFHTRSSPSGNALAAPAPVGSATRSWRPSVLTSAHRPSGERSSASPSPRVCAGEPSMLRSTASDGCCPVGVCTGLATVNSTFRSRETAATEFAQLVHDSRI